jgi:hypothetical protein
MNWNSFRVKLLLLSVIESAVKIIIIIIISSLSSSSNPFLENTLVYFRRTGRTLPECFARFSFFLITGSVTAFYSKNPLVFVDQKLRK